MSRNLISKISPQTLRALFQEIGTDADLLEGDLAELGAAIKSALGEAETALNWLLENHGNDPTIPGGVSYQFLMMLGTLCGGWQLGRAAKVAADKLADGAADTDFYNAKIISAKFYAEQALPRVAACAASVKAGSATLMSVSLDQLRGD